MIADGLRRLFRADAFVPTAAVFPSIDEAALARDLRLRDRARESAARDLPARDETTLDAAETAAVAAVEELRRKGLANYETNKDVYAKRLARLSSASMELRTVATQARGDFELETKDFRGQMTGGVRALREWNAALDGFRRRHRLDRPAYEDPPAVRTAAILLAAVLVETLLNGYLFAQRNELGLLGGALVALLVSLVNVGGSSLGGWFARFLRHRNLLLKLGGLLAFLLWMAFAVALNLGVAHFRDAVETLAGWSEAATRSLASFRETPLDLRSIESWLLMLVGLLVSLLAFIKLYLSGEPYPGYGRISRRFERALADYADHLTDALDSLERRRDELVESLRDANDTVRDNVGEAVDALYGHRMMRAQLAAFLAQCDLKANALLKLYRDENRAARTAPAPPRFDAPFAFPPHEDAPIDMGHREAAQAELREIGRVVDEAVAAIHEDYRQLKERYPEPSRLIGLDMGTLADPEPPARPHAPAAAQEAGPELHRALEVIEGSRRP